MGIRISNEELVETIQAVNEHGTQVKAAAALGIMQSTLSIRMKTAAQRGLLGYAPVLHGFRIKKITNGPAGDSIQQVPEPGEEFAVPEGHDIKGISALLDADGRITQQWVKTKIGELTIEETVERIKKALEGYAPNVPVSKGPTASSPDLLTLIPCNDWHIGMSAWRREVGANWDLKIAEKVIGAAIESTIERSPASGRAIILGGGDLLHADNGENKTAKSGNVLDVDGRYQKVVDMSCRLMVRTVDCTLRRHKRVIVRILKGNHDEHACVAIAYFLLAWYRNDPRVSVDVDASLFFEYRFGTVMLASTHGHLAKAADMPGIMAHRWAEDWGQTKHRFAHTFHLHHKEKRVTEGGGCICEIHQAPIPQDSWHYGKGFLSGRSVQAITYHREFGEHSRVNTAIMDAK